MEEKNGSWKYFLSTNKLFVGGIISGVLSVVLLGIFLLIWIFLIRSVKPEVGFEAVLIHKPVTGWGAEGIDPVSVKPGRQYVWFTTESEMFYMQPKQYEFDFDDLMSSDGVPLDFHVSTRLQILDSVAIKRDFGTYWFDNNIYSPIRNLVRQSVRKHGMNETAIDTRAIDEIRKEVNKGLNEYIVQMNIPIKVVDVIVGKANPPDAIKDQRIETAKQQQRKLSEEERRKAEDTRKGAEMARAEADNAYRLKMNLSPEQFISLQNIEMQREVCKDNSCTFIINDGVAPVINVRK